MSVRFLQKGDPRPAPLQAGKVRLYSMLFCPYAQRPRLVLAAKGISYDEVDINLQNKPEWYSSVHPEAKVPALEVGRGRVVIESLDIAEYLDSKFPEPPLWPADPEIKARHKLLLDQFEKVYMPYVQCMRATEPQTVMEVVPTVAAAMRPFEDELAENGHKFFGGDRPGMLDYMIWPWAERCEAIRAMYPQLKFPTEEFPQLLAWGEAMKEDPAVRASIMKPERHADFIRKFAEGTLDYNDL
ncbi:pyrimidodiazepine synthase-like isoform X1 [Schistocerca piceifrons]|uniref:pyrimidodiazepine synthase-like isoform X1 n=2 Tax=Schistocerca piceifrons TaxID=274613 RepID=UPI001F5F124E|nr:pyrimidodiazepine synthase-like isoform X1 [Schistocerca piceifrons]